MWKCFCGGGGGLGYTYALPKNYSVGGLPIFHSRLPPSLALLSQLESIRGPYLESFQNNK